LRFPRVRLTVRTLLALPAAIALLLVAIDPLTAGPDSWRYGSFEFDVVDARDRHPVAAYVTMTYVGPLTGQPGSGKSYKTLGLAYDRYRGMTPSIGYGGQAGIVRHRPGTIFFRHHGLTIAEGVRFRIEAEGYEPFTFTPADATGRPLEFEASAPRSSVSSCADPGHWECRRLGPQGRNSGTTCGARCRNIRRPTR
jgi:hypothetical protein